MAAPIVARYTTEAGEVELPAEMVPLHRVGEDDEDMAGTILYLASRAGAYCNGVVATTDGGRLGNFPALF